MSALTRAWGGAPTGPNNDRGRDPMDSARAQPVGGAWVWPDPLEVTPPSVPAGRPVRSGVLPGTARWPTDMPERAWPPLPESERAKRPAAAAPDRVSIASLDPADPFTARATAYSPPGRAGGAPSGRTMPPGAPSSPEAAMRAILAMPSQPRAERQPAPQVGASLAHLDWTIPDAPAPAVPRNDPSPSRLAYRLNRMWLTPVIRHFVRFGLPLMLILSVVGGWVSKPENRAALHASITGAIEFVQNQPLFTVTTIEVSARSPEVAEAVRQLLDLSFPVSSWDLDLGTLRARAEALDAVERAGLQIRTGGVLDVRITERVPAMVWRDGGGLYLVDAEGHRVARLATRAARADLPLIAGDGAPEAMAEAQALWAAAAPIQGRIRGLVRMGQRRWDLVLDRDQRVMLPETGAIEALERVVAMTESAQQLLSLDVRLVDMRNPSRPTLRLSEGAMSELLRNRSQNVGDRH